jgi:Cys-rich protein (TIGR01571 family)
MKWQGLVAFVLLVHIHGPVAAKTKAKTRSWEYDHDQLTQLSDSYAGLQQDDSSTVLLDTSSGIGEVESSRTELLDRLRNAEAIAEQEQHTLQSQQQVILGLAQTQHMLEAKIKALESSDRASLPDGSSRSQRFLTADDAGSFVAKKTTPEHLHHHHHEHRMGFPMVSITSFLIASDGDNFWADSQKHFWANIVAESVYVVLVFAGGMLYIEYFKNVPPKLPEAQSRTKDWQYGPCDLTDCQRDCQICVCGFCCVPIRWADTASSNVGNGGWVFMGFVPALLVFLILSACGPITFGVSELMLLLIVVLCRQRIRQLYDMPSGDCKSIFCDCLLWCFCTPCAVIQEARQIDLVEVPDGTLTQGLLPTGHDTQYATQAGVNQ